MSDQSSRLTHWVLWTAVVVFAFLFNWHVGHRGLFFYDFSIVFDGGWRIIQGQAPYKDFFMAHAPGSYFYLAAIFRLFGVDFSSFVLAACLLNAGAAALAIRIIWVLFPGFVWESVLAGVITAIWFQPPTGVFQIEQGSFFFALLALAVLLEVSRRASLSSRALSLIAGVSMGYAILCKQNSGLFFVPVFTLIALATPHRVRLLGSAAAGVALCFAGFWVWLSICSDPVLFWRHAIEIPSEFGSGRLSQDPIGTVMGLFFLRNTASALAAGVFSVVAGGAGLLYCVLARPHNASVLLGSLLACALPFYQNLFIITALNEPHNGVPFVGLSLALAVCVARTAFIGKQIVVILTGSGTQDEEEILIGARPAATAFYVLAGLLAGVLAAHGISVARSRLVNQFPANARFEEPLAVPRARSLIWGEPTFLGQTVVKKSDFEGLAAWLTNRRENFFVFPSTTILYGLLGRVSPQPWLFWLEGHSFGPADIPRLEAQAMASFERNNVRVVVLESDSFAHEAEEYKKMPKLRQWIETQFDDDARFGPYRVLTRKP